MRNKGTINPYVLRELLEYELKKKPNMSLREFLDKLNKTVKERDMSNFWSDGIPSPDIESGRITNRELNEYRRNNFKKGGTIKYLLTRLQKG